MKTRCHTGPAIGPTGRGHLHAVACGDVAARGGTTYSVWNQGVRAYDYYESPEVQKTLNSPLPSHIPAKELGATVAQASWPLPASARKVGSGEFAKGRIASVHRALSPVGAINMDTNTVVMISFGVAAFLLWKGGFLKS